jgi:hypothetical protein
MARQTDGRTIDHMGTDALAFLTFMGQVLALLWDAQQTKTAPGEPPEWLADACAAMLEDVKNLRGGVPQLARLSHVSPEHLSRTFPGVLWANTNRLGQRSAAATRSAFASHNPIGDRPHRHRLWFRQSESFLSSLQGPLRPDTTELPLIASHNAF